MTNNQYVILTPVDGLKGDRVRNKITEHGNKFIFVTQQQNRLMVELPNNAKSVIMFDSTETSWEITND